MLGRVTEILTSTQATGAEFSVNEDRVFILMEGHNGGVWNLQILTPAGTWMDIADDSGGISFDSDGLQFFYAQPWLNYRLNGGTVGAKAWLLSSKRNPGVN